MKINLTRLLYVVFILKLYAVQAAEKPNIIYILADDLGYADVGCYGGKIIKTPRIDRMREEGMMFTQHYSGSTVCAPTRCVLMTGFHTGHARIRGNGGPGLKDEDVTVAEVLKMAGYQTGVVGKWGLGQAGSAGVPNKQGFDFWFGYLSQTKAHHYYPPFLWKNNAQIHFPDNPQKRTHYSHDLFTDEAMGFIERNVSHPFFLYLAYTIPHVDLDVPDDSRKPYLDVIEEEGPYGKPGGQHYRHAKFPRATFAGMVSRLDRDVGRILDHLDKLKLSDNTLVVFSSDNGPTSAGGADPEFFNGNGPFKGIKRDLYEGGIRVPMIARWPGRISENSISHHVSAHWDVMATFAELSGAESESVPKTDGISFLPSLFDSGTQRQHEYLYWEFFERGGKQAIRFGDWKGVRLQVSKNRNAPLELYNLREDPSERNNVMGQHPDIVEKLKTMMGRVRTESDFYNWKVKKKKINK